MFPNEYFFMRVKIYPARINDFFKRVKKNVSSKGGKHN